MVSEVTASVFYSILLHSDNPPRIQALSIWKVFDSEICREKQWLQMLRRQRTKR